jgi:hypothetical protein
MALRVTFRLGVNQFHLGINDFNSWSDVSDGVQGIEQCDVGSLQWFVEHKGKFGLNAWGNEPMSGQFGAISKKHVIHQSESPRGDSNTCMTANEKSSRLSSSAGTAANATVELHEHPIETAAEGWLSPLDSRR